MVSNGVVPQITTTQTHGVISIAQWEPNMLMGNPTTSVTVWAVGANEEGQLFIVKNRATSSALPRTSSALAGTSSALPRWMVMA